MWVKWRFFHKSSRINECKIVYLLRFYLPPVWILIPGLCRSGTRPASPLNLCPEVCQAVTKLGTWLTQFFMLLLAEDFPLLRLCSVSMYCDLEICASSFWADLEHYFCRDKDFTGWGLQAQQSQMLVLYILSYHTSLVVSTQCLLGWTFCGHHLGLWGCT